MNKFKINNQEIVMRLLGYSILLGFTEGNFYRYTNRLLLETSEGRKFIYLIHSPSIMYRRVIRICAA